MANLLSSVLEYLVPLRSIAQSMALIAKLYEADLAARQIYPVTEEPSESDTEIWYGNQEQQKKERKIKGESTEWYNAPMEHQD